ncbi:MAG TPA: SO_0444 family Cu/Zn efflux transporter [Candidatus Binatia bacterium]|jgi:HflK protein|nr:SO_0444 family Cu/Zn efflux transporter [Candidatus Binatia bacterium]
MFVVDFLATIVRETGATLYEGGLWILFGFFIAGLLHVLIDQARLARHLGPRTIGSALRAALIGAPLPLCSCGVLPAAMELRRKGASREATVSFMIATPEVGVDSIALTAAYFGPVMAVIRPLVAVLTGVVAGALSMRLPDDEPAGGAIACGHDHDHEHGHEPAAPAVDVTPESWRQKFRRAVRYSFVDLFDDLAFWLAFAVLMTGILSAVLPADFFSRYMPSSIASMLLMVLVGAPMYVCASASTPLAALFVAKGATAGAALVFLLAGPATNGATIGAVRRFLGPGLLPIYLGSIAGVSLTAGILLDLLLPDLAQSIRIDQPDAVDMLAPVKIIGAMIFGWLLVRSLMRTGLGRGIDELLGNFRAAGEWTQALELRRLATSKLVWTVAGVWLVAAVLGGFLRVPPGAHAVVQRLGALSGEPRAPGLLYAVPIIDQVAIVQTEQVRERPVNFSLRPGSLERVPDKELPLYVTADENLLDLRAEVQFRALDPVAYQLRVEDPQAVLTAIVRGQLVIAAARHPIDKLYTSDRAETEAFLLQRVRTDAEAMRLGIEVLGVRLLDVHAPQTVHEAFRDVASAHEDRLTTIHQANEYSAGVVAVARGDATRLVAEAEGRSMERLAAAHADATRFTALATAYAAAPGVTETRMYLETAERVLAGARKVIRSTDEHGPRGYELWVRGDGTPVMPPGVAPQEVAAPAARPRASVAPASANEEDDQL